MPFPEEEDARPDTTGTTLASLLCSLPTPRLRHELEIFRIKYESKFGHTDLTKRYTSTWPTDQQDWLLEHHPERFWDGLPPFVQAFLKEQMHAAHRNGKLDDMPGDFLQLYLQGKMSIDGSGPMR
jgi:hypothetical protein